MVTKDRKKKVLLVDDNEIQLSVTEIQLKEEYEVTVAKSGKEALDCLCHGFVPDVILLDIIMPDMDGWETFGRIKAISLLHEVPIIFVSTLNGKIDIDRGYEMGAADFITRPYKVNDFLERVRKILNKNQSTAQSI